MTRGERSVGGGRGQERPTAAREAEEFDAAIAASRRRQSEQRGTPMNVIRRPLELPPMVNIKDGQSQEPDDG